MNALHSLADGGRLEEFGETIGVKLKVSDLCTEGGTGAIPVVKNVKRRPVGGI